MPRGWWCAFASLVLGTPLALAQPAQTLPTALPDPVRDQLRMLPTSAMPANVMNAGAYLELPPAGANSQGVTQLPEPTPAESTQLPAPKLLTPQMPEPPSAGSVMPPAACEFLSGGPEPSLYWTSADFLIWWTKHAPLNLPLVTSTLNPVQPLAAIGAPLTTVLFGESDLRYGNNLGARVTFGYWFDPGSNLGVESTGLIALPHSIRFNSASMLTTAPPLPLARPFFDSLSRTSSSLTAALAGTSNGTIQATSSSLLWGLETNLVRAVDNDGCFRTCLLGGFRYLNLAETIDVLQTTQGLVNGNITFTGLPVPASDSVRSADHFGARNQFYGGQIGGRWQWLGEALYLALDGKLAVGVTHQSVNITGNTSQLIAGATVPGGLLAVSANIGTRSDNVLSVVPQIGVNAGYRWGERCRLYVGYDFLYWSRVVRPGGQIDPLVNSAQVPASPNFGIAGGGTRPIPLFKHNDFWAQGLHLGFEVAY